MGGPAAARVLSAVAAAQRREAEREEYFRLVVENSTDVVTILAADGTVRYTNPTYHRLTGYESVLDAGPDTWTDRYIHPDDRERVFKAHERALRTPGIAAPLEYRFRHADGHWLHLESIANNLLDDPRVAGVLVVSRDITEREHAKQSRVVNTVLSALIVGGGQADLAEGHDAGLAMAPRYQVVVTNLQGAGFELSEADIADFAHRAKLPSGSLCGTFGVLGVVIAPAHGGDDDPERFAERLRAVLAAAVPDEAELRIAVGSSRGTGFGIKASFDEAVRLIGLGERLGIGGIITPRRAVIPALLDASPSGATALAKILQPLLAADERSRANLVETLRCYLANDSSVHKTAEQMHVHRNTVRSRLRSIETAIGGAIAAEKVVLQLALLAHELADAPRWADHPSIRSTSPDREST